VLSLIILFEDIKWKKRIIFKHINSKCRGLISAKDTKGRCSRYCYMQISSCPEQKRQPCYFMFFRLNVAIAVRTDFSSVFINQTRLSFEFKRLKLGQLSAITLSKRFRSFSSLLQWNRKWYSTSTSPEEQRWHFLSCRRVPWYLPVSIFNWWQEIRSYVRHLLYSKLFRTDRYITLPKLDLNVIKVLSFPFVCWSIWSLHNSINLDFKWIFALFLKLLNFIQNWSQFLISGICSKIVWVYEIIDYLYPFCPSILSDSWLPKFLTNTMLGLQFWGQGRFQHNPVLCCGLGIFFLGFLLLF
jgi:hypothetical protein